MENLKPPYSSTGQADKILDIFSRISPKKIDSKFIYEHNIATSSNASAVVKFVKWLGIIDSENNVNEDIASKLRLLGEERDKEIADLIKLSYKKVFEVINMQQAKREDLVNFFINNYGYGVAPAKNASILLLHLCGKYGIPISDELKKKTYNLDTTKSKGNKPHRKTQTFSTKKSNYNNQDEGIFIKVPNSGLIKEFTINNKEEFEEVFNEELEKISRMIKINFGWE